MGSQAVVTLTGMAVGSGTVLASGIPRFGELARHLTAPHRWIAVEGSDAAVTTLAGALLWLVALWVALGLVLTAGALLPGQAGMIARRLAHRLTPAALRRAMITAAGASILLSPATALAAPAAGTSPTPAATQPVLPAVGWVTDPSVPASHTPAPVAPTRSAATNPSPTAATTPHRRPPPGSSPNASAPTTAADPPIRTRPGSTSPSPPSTPAYPSSASAVTVRPGDSLWSIAARHLAANRSAARTAQAWPRWYAANRQAIGSRPDLIRPGTRLVAPPPTGSEPGA